jgi:hypothetical protein
MAAYLSRVFTSPFFQNRFVLYGTLLLVLLSILRHIANRNINAVVLMALIGLVMANFSKNMIVVLLTAVVSVFLLEMLDSHGVMEGMKTKEGATNNGNDDDAESDDAAEDESGGKKSAEKVKEKNTTMKETKKKVKTEKAPAKKEKQGMSILTPAKYNEGDDDDDDDGSGKGDAKSKTANRIDYASTLEEAYDNIETIIGEEGVRGLTDQTKSLMNQQKELMNNMKDMGPLLKSAEGFMKQITGNGGIGGITEMLKGFATPAAKK